MLFYELSVDITNNLHKEFGKTVSAHLSLADMIKDTLHKPHNIIYEITPKEDNLSTKVKGLVPICSLVQT